MLAGVDLGSHSLTSLLSKLTVQALVLALAGVDLGGYSLAQWRELAHEAAAYLTGSQLLQVRAGAACLC